ncbi:hypothetical protein DERP_013799 [Dermatophagoides pteronyssinus]|uniref:Transmembrane protein n=1 Tax=Dermatophagoides pteronyssinus TaxID=6956 RepID=A0ABQ8IV61_DERPT|nr:hypothetical protein DERP_014356 [Dermatophagoides pteronyssinus]KAH9420351.1 hypothetical protein DERP_013799 [Dermatophagoides pteronyssinus]
MVLPNDDDDDDDRFFNIDDEGIDHVRRDFKSLLSLLSLLLVMTIENCCLSNKFLCFDSSLSNVCKL